MQARGGKKTLSNKGIGSTLCPLFGYSLASLLQGRGFRQQGSVINPIQKTPPETRIVTGLLTARDLFVMQPQTANRQPDDFFGRCRKKGLGFRVHGGSVLTSFRCRGSIHGVWALHPHATRPASSPASGRQT